MTVPPKFAPGREKAFARHVADYHLRQAVIPREGENVMLYYYYTIGRAGSGLGITVMNKHARAYYGE